MDSRTVVRTLPTDLSYPHSLIEKNPQNDREECDVDCFPIEQKSVSCHLVFLHVWTNVSSKSSCLACCVAPYTERRAGH
jgi:hypothetical protein